MKFNSRRCRCVIAIIVFAAIMADMAEQQTIDKHYGAF